MRSDDLFPLDLYTNVFLRVFVSPTFSPRLEWRRLRISTMVHILRVDGQGSAPTISLLHLTSSHLRSLSLSVLKRTLECVFCQESLVTDWYNPSLGNNSEWKGMWLRYIVSTVHNKLYCEQKLLDILCPGNWKIDQDLSVDYLIPVDLGSGNGKISNFFPFFFYLLFHPNIFESLWSFLYS